MTDILVTHGDMRRLGYCNRGAREWFTRHQLDWSLCIDQGLPPPMLLATGDSMAEDVVAAARERIASEVNDGR